MSREEKHPDVLPERQTEPAAEPSEPTEPTAEKQPDGDQVVSATSLALARPPSSSQAAPAPPMATNGHATNPHPDPTVNRRAATFAVNAKRRLKQHKKTFKEMKKPPGGFDPTPLPDVPPGYTVKFGFRRAKDLPIADIHTGSSDPFIEATLFTNPPNLLKRHKEDPDLVHRTRPVRRCLDPEWNEEWIVANVPATGFKLKCRLYDEDYPAKDDRLGNVTVEVHKISDDWNEYTQDRVFKVKKRSGGKSVYFFKAILSVLSGSPITPTLWLAIEVLGKSGPTGYGKMYTVGPTGWIKHFSPMIGRMIGTKVNKYEGDDVGDDASEKNKRRTKKYDFQANEMQLSGPVPPKLYHRYVEFRPLIGLMFSRSGIRGRLLNGMLQKQHRRVYNFDSSTEYGNFDSCSEEASVQFLRMAHFDEGGRMFTYVLTLDGMFRFTETGKEFGIDMLSKHSMHSNVATYIACSGEFFIRREADVLEREREREKGHRRQHSKITASQDEEEPRKSMSSWRSWKRSGTGSSSKSQHESRHSKGDTGETSQEGSKDSKQAVNTDTANEDKDEDQPTSSNHPPKLQPEHSSFMRALGAGRLFSHTPNHPTTSHSKASGPLPNPKLYRLFIDNDSGTYRPEKSLLPDLQMFFEEQFPGLNITAYDCDNEELKRMKTEQREVKKSKGARINMVLNRSPSASSFSSGDESRLDEMEASEEEEHTAKRTRREMIKAMRKGKGKAVESIV